MLKKAVQFFFDRLGGFFRPGDFLKELMVWQLFVIFLLTYIYIPRKLFQIFSVVFNQNYSHDK